MDSGSFFELRENSDLLKGQILFSYTGFISDKGLQYPVVLVFNKEHIDFYFTGLISKENAVEGDYPEFIETLLFSLNLHKGKENISKLNDSLRDLFDKEFPVLPQFIIYSGNDSRGKYDNHLTYANLDQFSANENIGEKLLYRTLILDFLFDVYHSDVFDNCPGFTLIKQHLNEIPFIQAIKRKAEFYYQVTNNQPIEKLVTFDSTNSNYIDNLIKAQENWLDILQEEDSNKFINSDNKWFDDVETEVKNVLKIHFDPKYFKIEDKRAIILPQQIQVKTNNRKGFLKKLFKKNQKPKYAEELKKRYYDFLSHQKGTTLKWFIKRNSIIDAWRSTKLKWFGFTFAIFIVLLVFAIVYFIIQNKIYSYHNSDLTDYYWWFLCGLLILILYVLVGDQKPIKNYFTGLFELLMIPFGILMLSSSFIIFELTSFGNVDIILLSKISILLLFLTISLGLFLLLYNYEKKSHPNLNKKTSLKKVFSLLLIGLMFSFLANLIVLNYEYKDFLGKYSLIDEIWKKAFDKTDSISNHKEETFSNLKFYASQVSDSAKIKKLISEKESSHVDAEKEEYFYLPLEQLIITRNGEKLYPVLKRINVLGFEIITLPSVLFINTFLTLLLAVLIQVVLNHKKFLEGGKA